MSTDNTLTELRLATRTEHDRIEQVLRLTEPMDLARYAAVIGGFAAFLGAWEPRVRDALPPRLRPWIDGRRRGAFASADVTWLRAVAGLEPAVLDAGAAGALPLADVAEVFGSLYVIEGSALGGRVIAPRLETTLGLRPDAGARYFHGFGDETGAMWRDFRLTAAREIGDSREATQHACESAKRTFGALVELFMPLAPASVLLDAVEEAARP